MKEILITSSVLILAITALRFVFREKISRRLQYALWALVLLRLLIPFSLPASSMSVLSGTQTLENRFSVQQELGGNIVLPETPVLQTPATQTPISPAPEKSVDWNAILQSIWLGGAAVMALWFFGVNLHFARTLKKNRREYAVKDFPLPVYLTDKVVSPCLFGLFKPAVYLTEKAVGTEESRRIVLTHEFCHYRHKDHIVSFLRCLCLSIYWFNPLVWLAAVLSKADGEMACDEAVLRCLGEENRLPYGRTLVDMIARGSSSANMFSAATTMVDGKNSIRRRLTRIVSGRKTALWAAVCVMLCIAICIGCTFTAGKKAAKSAANLEEAKSWFAQQTSNYEIICGEAVDDAVVLLTGTKNPGTNNYQMLQTFVVSKGKDGYSVTAMKDGERAMSAGIAAHVLIADGLTIVFGDTGDSIFDFANDRRLNADFAKIRLLLKNGKTENREITGNAPYLLVFADILEIADIEFISAQLTTKYSAFFGENLMDNTASYDISNIFPSHQDAPVLPPMPEGTFQLTHIHENAEYAVPNLSAETLWKIAQNGHGETFDVKYIGEFEHVFRIRHEKPDGSAQDFYCYRSDEGQPLILAAGEVRRLDEALMLELENAIGMHQPLYKSLAITRTVTDSNGGEVADGDGLEYFITITNLTNKTIKQVEVHDTIGKHAGLSSKDGILTITGDDPRWVVDLEAGETVTLRYKVKVGGLPGDYIYSYGGSVAGIPFPPLVTHITAEAY